MAENTGAVVDFNALFSTVQNWEFDLTKYETRNILKEPLADYFWYRYSEYGGELTYLLPHHVVAPGDAIRVDKEKIKIFLRDIKIETLLQ